MTTLPRIGFIGIGMMGHGMAKNLLAKGYPADLQGEPQPRAPGRPARGRREGGEDECRGRARRRHRLHLRHGLAPGRGDRATAPTASLQAARDGLVVVDTSTAEPSSTARLRADLAAQGAKLIDAPLARTPKEAEEGRLNTMVGAEPADFERIKPVLQAFCENIFHVGPPGDGHVLKLVNNMMAMSIGGVRSPKPLRSPPRAGLSLDEAARGRLGRRRQLRHLPDDVRPDARRRPRRHEVRDRQRAEGPALLHPPRRVAAGPSFVAEAAHQSFVQAANLGFGDKFIASLFEAQERTAKVRIVDNVGRQP